MFKRNQKGVIDPIFIIVLVLVLAVGGFIYWRTTQKEETPQPVTQTTQVQNEEVVEEENSDEELFTVDLPDGWLLKEVKGEIGQATGKYYVYENGTHTVEVQVEPGGGRGVMSDISWRYQVNNQGDAFTVTSSNKTVCSEDEGFCDLDNQEFRAFLKQDDNQEKETVDGYRYNFYYTNSASASINDALLDDFESIVESIKLSS